MGDCVWVCCDCGGLDGFARLFSCLICWLGLLLQWMVVCLIRSCFSFCGLVFIELWFGV